MFNALQMSHTINMHHNLAYFYYRNTSRPYHFKCNSVNLTYGFAFCEPERFRGALQGCCLRKRYHPATHRKVCSLWSSCDLINFETGSDIFDHDWFTTCKLVAMPLWKFICKVRSFAHLGYGAMHRASQSSHSFFIGLCCLRVNYHRKRGLHCPSGKVVIHIIIHFILICWFWK